jgi:hypothetical protein
VAHEALAHVGDALAQASEQFAIAVGDPVRQVVDSGEDGPQPHVIFEDQLADLTRKHLARRHRRFLSGGVLLPES